MSDFTSKVHQSRPGFNKKKVGFCLCYISSFKSDSVENVDHCFSSITHAKISIVRFKV